MQQVDSHLPFLLGLSQPPNQGKRILQGFYLGQFVDSFRKMSNKLRVLG